MKVVLQNITAQVDESSGTMLLDGISCDKNALHCQREDKGTYVWDDQDAKCSKTHSQIYKGKASLHNTKNNASNIAVISNEEWGSYAGKIIQSFFESLNNERYISFKVYHIIHYTATWYIFRWHQTKS